MTTENLPRDGGFIVSEANGTLSRDAIIILDGIELVAGQIYALDANEKAIPYTAALAVAGISWGAYSPVGVDGKGAGFVRLGEVAKEKVTVFDGATEAEINAAFTELEALNIVGR